MTTAGVIPSLYVDYKKTRIKQYHKGGCALRTETTINDTRDFDIGRSLKNLPALKAIGFAANRRLLEVQKVTHDCTLGETAFQTLTLRHELRQQCRAPFAAHSDHVQPVMGHDGLCLQHERRSRAACLLLRYWRVNLPGTHARLLRGYDARGAGRRMLLRRHDLRHIRPRSGRQPRRTGSACT